MTIFNDMLAVDTLSAGIESVMDTQQLEEKMGESTNPATLGVAEDIDMRVVTALRGLGEGGNLDSMDSEQANLLVSSGLVTVDGNVTLTEQGTALLNRIQSGEFSLDAGNENFIKRTMSAFKDFQTRRANSLKRFNKSKTSLTQRAQSIREKVESLGEIKEGAYGFRIKSEDAFGMAKGQKDMLDNLGEVNAFSTEQLKFVSRNGLRILDVLIKAFDESGKKITEMSRVTEDPAAMQKIANELKTNYAGVYGKQIDQLLTETITIPTNGGDYQGRATPYFFGGRQFVSFTPSNGTYSPQTVSWGVSKKLLDQIRSNEFPAASKEEMITAADLVEQVLKLDGQIYGKYLESENMFKKYIPSMRALDQLFNDSSDAVVKSSVALAFNIALGQSTTIRQLVSLLTYCLEAGAVVSTLYCAHSIQRYGKAAKEAPAAEAGTETAAATDTAMMPAKPDEFIPTEPDYLVADEEAGTESVFDYFRSNPVKVDKLDSASAHSSMVGLSVGKLVARPDTIHAFYHPHSSYSFYMQRDGKVAGNIASELNAEAKNYQRATALVNKLTEDLALLGQIGEDEEANEAAVQARMDAVQATYEKISDLRFLGNFQFINKKDRKLANANLKAYDEDGKLIPSEKTAGDRELKARIVGSVIVGVISGAAGAVLLPIPALIFAVGVARTARNVLSNIAANYYKLTPNQTKQLIEGSITDVTGFKGAAREAMSAGRDLLNACAKFGREWERAVKDKRMNKDARIIAGVHAQAVNGLAQTPMMLTGFMENLVAAQGEAIKQYNIDVKAQS